LTLTRLKAAAADRVLLAQSLRENSMRRIAVFGLSALMLTSSLAACADYDTYRGPGPPAPYPYWDNRRDPPPGHEFRDRDRDRVPTPWANRDQPPPNWSREAWAHRQNWLRRNGHKDDDHNSTAGLIVGAILGFALGAAVVDSQQQQQQASSRLNDPAWIAYCARRYPSFDPYTGTYFGSDGLRHYCR
jgi:hypothetical protein